MAEVRRDMEELALPSCVPPALQAVGSACAGTLGADEWHTFCTVNLLVTLVRLWGDMPLGSNKNRMLSNFADLITAVKIATQKSLTNDEISSYHTHMSRYLEELPSLFPGVTFIPNHHLSLHIADNLWDWGPASGTYLFGFERGNLVLRSVETNNKIGMILSLQSESHSVANTLKDEMASTMLDRFCMMQNLRRLFESASLPFLTDEVIQAFGRAFDSDPTGEQISGVLSDIAASGNSDGLLQQTQNLHGGKPQAIDEDILHLLYSRDGFRDQEQVSVHYEPRAPFHSAIQAKGFRICPRNNSPNDSNILYRTGENSDWSAGQVTQIFTGSWIECQELKSEVFLVVEELAELHPSELHHDIYRRFPAFKACLCRDQIAGRRVITLDSFLCQFARKMHRSSGLKQDLVLVFPITKVRPIVSGMVQPIKYGDLYRKDFTLDLGKCRHLDVCRRIARLLPIVEETSHDV